MPPWSNSPSWRSRSRTTASTLPITPVSKMIPDQDREAITRLAEHYSVTRLLLFGSSTDPTREGRDIDLAVEGLPPQDFFRFYGDLLFSVSKPVDLVDLAQNSKLTRHIRREGLPLYEAPQRTHRS